MGYTKSNEDYAKEIKEQINDFREIRDNWKTSEVKDLLEELDEIGYFYDEESWDVFLKDDVYYDETPLTLYVDDDEDEDEYLNQRVDFSGFDENGDFDDDEF